MITMVTAFIPLNELIKLVYKRNKRNAESIKFLLLLMRRIFYNEG